MNIISPGAIATPIFWGGHTNGQQISAEHAEARMAKYSRMAAKALPLAPSDGHGGESRDIALAAVYLGSDESRWVTGIDLLVVSPDSARKTLARNRAVRTNERLSSGRWDGRGERGAHGAGGGTARDVGRT